MSRAYTNKNDARAEVERRREAGENVVLDANIDTINGKTVIRYIVKEVTV